MVLQHIRRLHELIFTDAIVNEMLLEAIRRRYVPLVEAALVGGLLSSQRFSCAPLQVSLAHAGNNWKASELTEAFELACRHCQSTLLPEAELILRTCFRLRCQIERPNCVHEALARSVISDRVQSASSHW